MLARSLFQINAIAILQNRSSQYARDIQKTVSTPVKSLVKCFRVFHLLVYVVPIRSKKKQKFLSVVAAKNKRNKSEGKTNALLRPS